MCESHAYLVEEGEPKMVMEDVVDIREEAGRLVLSNIIGEELTLDAEISEISFFNHRILLAKK
jgi:predicted RNA-binding protein